MTCSQFGFAGYRKLIRLCDLSWLCLNIPWPLGIESKHIVSRVEEGSGFFSHNVPTHVGFFLIPGEGGVIIQISTYFVIHDFNF